MMRMGKWPTRLLLRRIGQLKILSPDQSQTKVTKNILHYLQHGTEVGWLIDPYDGALLQFESAYFF